VILDYLCLAENMEAVASVNSFRLHELKGNRAGIWSITVKPNWRITLAVSDDACELLDYEDYH
jgi:proteic killer suppression protein